MIKKKIYSNLNSNFDLIRFPLVTEKASQLFTKNKYTFIVDPKINKLKIKKIIELLFKVKIIKVNTSHLAKKNCRVGKYTGTKPHYKKAIIKLARGNRINLFSDN